RGDSYVGGAVGRNFGVIKSVRAIDVDIDGTAVGNYTGGLVGESYSGTIDDCHVEGGSVHDDNGGVGGLVGLQTSTATNSTTNVVVTAPEDPAAGGAAGGLFGSMSADAVASDCVAHGPVSG